MGCEELFNWTRRFYSLSDEEFNEFSTLLRENPTCVQNRDWDDDNTLLHWAANDNNVKVVALLLELGADIEVRNNDGETPLHRTAQMEAVQVMEYLLKHVADPNALDRIRETPLFTAVCVGGNAREYIKAAQMTSMLIEFGADIHLKNSQGCTPLHIACLPQTARILLKHGADFNARNNKGETPLIESASVGNEDVVKVLLEFGADINLRDAEGRTLLHLFVYDDDGGNLKRAKQCIALGADIEAKDNAGRTPLYQASASHYTPGVKLLIAKGADVNSRDNEGHTPLYAVETEQYLGTNAYYCPPPLGEGDPKLFGVGKRRIARLLLDAGGSL